MNINKIKIKGLRGFSVERTIHFAIPDGEHEGSGLTVFVGPNNGGKSTIIEAVDIFTKYNTIKGIPLNSRFNAKQVEMHLEYGNDNYYLYSDSVGGSNLFLKKNGKEITNIGNEFGSIFILSSNRYISDNFSGSDVANRENYGHFTNLSYRDKSNSRSEFGSRLRNAQRNRDKFNECLKKVINPVPVWYLEMEDLNNQYLEFDNSGIKSRSSGSGDGIINIFNIVDSLYDSKENEPILIDEPEKSLHPSLQRKLLRLLLEYSKNRQIIITTHSPFFVDWKNIVNGGMKVKRVCNNDNSINIFDISEETINNMRDIVNDINNPHSSGLNAIESLFLDDNIIVVEGQDDVVGYTNMFKKYNFNPNATFYGWGVGGFNKFRIILRLLKDIGYKKVFVIADGNIDDNTKREIEDFEGYDYIMIPTADIRNKDKANRNIKKQCEKIKNSDFLTNELKEKVISILKEGIVKTYLLDNPNDGCVVEEYIPFVQEELIPKIKEYFNDYEMTGYDWRISPEEQERLNLEYIETIVNNEVANNPVRKRIIEKYNDQEGGGTYHIDSKIKNGGFYRLVYMVSESYGDKNIEYSLQYDVDIAKVVIKLKDIRIINSNFSNIDFDDLLIYE